MTNEETIFAEALGKGAAPERSAYLDKACAGDPQLRRQVESLLLAHQKAVGILEAPPVGLDVTTQAPRPSSEGVGSIVGPYKLLEQIGGGGMGVVYMAEQDRPVRRKVALKIIKPGMDSRQVIARFEAERQALTMMDHPNIARVLDAGTTDAGRPYFVMELVKGMPITDYCDQARLTTRQRLELFMTVCRAVQHAHQKGVIHRDLKPTNVLVTLHDDKPVPKVIDFGIAKATGQVLTDKTLFTNYAQMLGTPLYMSPEQAQISGLDVDTRSDIYSLGVLLYELLTGTTPFDHQRLRDAAYDEMRRIIREEDPPNPSTRLSTVGEQITLISAHRHTDPKHLRQLVHGELDWIVMKALEKERARRYETANGFATDVQRYLNDEAVEACPASAGYRFRKFIRRHRLAWVTSSAVAVAIVLALVGLAISNVRIKRATHQKEIALQDKAAALADAQEQGRQAQAARGVAEEQRNAAIENLYVASMGLAHKDWEAGNVGRMNELLKGQEPGAGEADRRGWEWYYLLSLCHRDRQTFRGHRSGVRSVCATQDGRRIASGSSDGTICIWDAETSRRLQTLPGEACGVASVSWAPDGNTLAAGDDLGRLFVWDVQLAAKSRVPDLGMNWISTVGWSPDGSKIAAAGSSTDSEHGIVVIVDARTRTPLHKLSSEVGMVRSLAWSPDGRHLLCGENYEGRLQVWDVATGTLAASWRAHRHIIGAVAWRPDGRQFASASADEAIKVWEADSWKNLLTMPAAHRGIVTALTWSGDGAQLLSGSEDGLIKSWDPSTGRENGVLRGHSGTVASLFWSSRGPSILSGGADATVKVWDPATQSEHRSLAGYACTAWSPDGKLIATPAPKRQEQMASIDVYEVASGRKVLSLAFPVSRHVFGLAWSPDQQHIAAALGQEGRVVVWNVSSREQVLSELAHGFEARSVAWSPDSHVLASGGLDRRVKLWDVEGRRTIYTSSENADAVGSVAWSPDGGRLATGAMNGAELKIFDAKSRQMVLDLSGVRRFSSPGQYTISWNPAGDRLAACYQNGEIVIWDAATGRQVTVMHGHTSGLRAVAWSPDGNRLASGGYDRYLKIWDARSGRELLSLAGHDVGIFSVNWSPDGQKLATAASREVKIWDASTGYRLKTVEPLPESADAEVTGHAPATAPTTAP